MIRVSGVEARRAVELLDEQHAHQRVRQRQRGQRHDACAARRLHRRRRGRRRCRSRTRRCRRRRASARGASASSRVVHAPPRSSSATIRSPCAGGGDALGLGGEQLRHGAAAVARRGLQLDQVERVVARQALRVVGVARRPPSRASGGPARRCGASSARPRRGASHHAARTARRARAAPTAPRGCSSVRTAGCITWTTMSPASTSTHSPVSSPSTPMIVGAGLLELVADVVRERLHLPVGIGAGDDQRVVQAGELADVEDRMSWALMSSRAATAVSAKR